MKIVFLDASTMGDTPIDPIAALGELTLWPTSTKEEALQRVNDCEVIIVNKVKVDRELIAAYYQGMASVRKIGMYDDTKRYVASVVKHRNDM